MNKIQIRTDDGVCRAYTFGDAGPSLLFFMDGIGIRSALFEMGEHMAAGGYRVLLPDLFYRAGEYVAPDPAKLFADEEVRKQHFAKFMATTNVANTMKDTRTFLEHLPGKVGVTGYCMGGKMALCAAAYHPDRIVAAAAFHPGGLINDTADSLDKLAPKIKARVFVGGAMDDQSFPDDHKQKLEAALTAASVPHVVMTFPCKHGWVPSDTPVHDKAGTDRHYEALFALLKSAL